MCAQSATDSIGRPSGGLEMKSWRMHLRVGKKDGYTHPRHLSQTESTLNKQAPPLPQQQATPCGAATCKQQQS